MEKKTTRLSCLFLFMVTKIKKRERERNLTVGESLF